MIARPYEALLAIGSNVEADVHVPEALALLRGRFEVRAVSRAVRSAAVGVDTPQPPFVNLAVRIRTDLPYPALREVCRRIEEACGRTRTSDRFAPRTMDIDLVHGNAALARSARGALPDPDLTRYAHLREPAAEIWPEAVGVRGHPPVADAGSSDEPIE